MKKILSSYSVAVTCLVVALASFTQAINPSFMASADSMEISKLSSALTVAVIGVIFFLIGFIMIVVKVMKGNRRNG